ncbi:hypothetical protein CN128_07470 [Sinorhizobium meliloti]|uniref:hypothetical protein n=1 Tax=Rhizobium meliloti TaxID=382 RepID=UPI000FD93189|nr:hypothetical protein [Sinorhizobium meliloti]RVM58879.1 hypothetical protein CN128_07470 [Sinorhizobium meliloti]
MLQINLDSEQLVAHYRDVSTTLTSLGCGPKTRAAIVQKAAQTLKQYAVDPSSAQHRIVPPEDLDILRSEASRLHWEMVDYPISRWIGAEGYAAARSIRPTIYTAFGANGLFRGDSSFLPRAIEVAESFGGWLQTSRDRHGERIPLDDAVALVDSQRFQERSRWRRAAYRLRSAGRGDVVVRVALANGYGEHSVGQIAVEYERWRVAVKPAALIALEEAVAAQEIA